MTIENLIPHEQLELFLKIFPNHKDIETVEKYISDKYTKEQQRLKQMRYNNLQKYKSNEEFRERQKQRQREYYKRKKLAKND